MSTVLIATQGSILRSAVGSTVHGLHIPGTDDQDEMGVCLEPAEYVIGLKKFEQHVYRTQPDGVRSGPGDLDLTIYSLRKYMALFVKGNPTIMLPIFAPEDALLIKTQLGEELRQVGLLLVSRQAGYRFLGYLKAQKERVLGLRGQARRPNRPELVEAHGYDTKYAGHMVRLGYQGEELLTTGRITLPMPEPHRSWILAIRRGEVAQDEVMAMVESLEETLRRLVHTSDLPPEPDFDLANDFLVEAYQRFWAGEVT